MFGVEGYGSIYASMHAARERKQKEVQEYRQMLLDSGMSPYDAEQCVLKRREIEAMESLVVAESRHADAAITEARKVGWFRGR